MKLFANTKGQDLISHLKAIGIVCKELSKNLGLDEDFCKLADKAVEIIMTGINIW